MQKILSKYLKNNKQLKNVFGEFEVGKQLGAGGTSIVREAILDGKPYAIKFLHENIADKETTAFKRFKQAYINLSEIQHSGVILPQIHIDILKIDDNTHLPYTIMPKADMTLKDWAKKAHAEDKMTFEFFEQTFNAIVRVVDTIHQYNIIHRDIKPENFFLMNQKLMLGDFDIAKFSDENHIRLVETKKGDRLANFAFSAPEQFQKDVKFEELTKSADWFAVGQVLYWLTTQRTLRGQEQISLSLFDTKYSKYESLIRKLLDQNPKNRLNSAKEIYGYLNQSNRWNRWENWDRGQKDLTYRVIEKYSLGEYGVHQFRELDDIKNIMMNLKEHYDESTKIIQKNESNDVLHSLFWTRGSHNDHIRGGIEKSPSCDRCWILGNFELKIKSILIWDNITSFRANFLIIETDFLEGTGIYDKNYYEKNYIEEFGVYEGRAIKLNEYGCGWANIDGKRVNVFGKAEKKAKILKSTLFFIAPQGSFINDRFKEEEIDTIIELYESENCFNEEILSLLQKL